MNPSKKLALTGLALALVAAGSYGAYAVHDKRAQERAIVALVAETTAELRTGLAAPQSAGEPLGKVEKHFEALQSFSPTRARALASGAELYIVSAREILRRRDAGAALEQRAVSARAALLAHMASARGRNASWINDAAALKRKVQAEHAELQRTLHALDELLETLPEATKRLSPHVERRLLLEDAARAAARKQVGEAITRADRQLTELRRAGGI